MNHDEIGLDDEIDESKCPKTHEPHVPDWSTVSLTSDGGQFYLDVNCKDCGRSGCVGSRESLESEICW